mgnify:CR=1 FL=1
MAGGELGAFGGTRKTRGTFRADGCDENSATVSTHSLRGSLSASMHYVRCDQSYG